MLTQTVNKDGLVFSVYLNGRTVHFKEWSDTDDCIYFFPLATLVDNGHATYDKDCCVVPFENLYLFSDDDKAILGIPPQFDKTIRLRGIGMLNTPEFKYKVDFLSYAPDGEVLINEQCGNVIIINSKKYLLSKDQYDMLRRVEAFNNTNESEKTTDYNLRQFSYIKQLAQKSGCILDSYLENESVYVPEKIKIEIGRDEEGFTIDPSVPIEESEKFKRTFEKMRRVQPIYPVANDKGERVRVVLSPEQKGELEFIKESGGRHKTREDIQDIVSNPTNYFDPDQFDLSDFYSDRVIEIGVYKPKFYPFICPYKSCWIAGATVETPENGTSKIEIKDEDELKELEQQIQEAEEYKKAVVNYKDAQIDLNDARFLADMARKQLANSKEPVKPVSHDHEVLIIEENAEELNFTAAERNIETGDKYTLFNNPYLAEGFSLKEHQKEGVAWLQHLFNQKACGCLMADDMGLGKTLQLLYFIDWHSRKYSNHNPYLIVAPVSLLENWENEYHRFFSEPRLNISVLSAREVPRKIDKNMIQKMQSMDIILTNYESLRISQLNFCAVDFDIIVLDEAQRIKSPGTMVTNAAKALKGRFKVAMTGTPVENSLLDLWCIMDFCVPGLLGNAKSFAAKYQNPLKKEDTDLLALGNEIHDTLGLYFMRRLKQDAAKDLPEKHVFKESRQMPEVQKNIYKHVVNQYVIGAQPNMLLTLMDIKQVSEHPYLYDSTLMDHDDEDVINSSARLQVTIAFVDRIKDRNEKVIVFAERKDTQRMLQHIFFEKYGIVCKIINGDTPPFVSPLFSNKQSRQSSIDEFQAVDGFSIIIMSPVAAGMGLNVTAANNVIHYSRHWNPAKENQATDRAYRIGQTKDVYVYYPLAVCSEFRSFDETLDDLLNRKTSLATSTIFPTERIEVSPDDLGQMLFS